MAINEQPYSLSKQKQLREARANACYRDDGAQHVVSLIGVPLVLRNPKNELDWSGFTYELSASLSSTLEPLGVRVLFETSPFDVGFLHEQAATTLARWLEEGPPNMPLSRNEGPRVWVGRAYTDQTRITQFGDLFFKVNTGLGKLTTRTNQRISALLEESSVLAKVYPPTAYWNSLSLSRILYVRNFLGALPNLSGVSAHRAGSKVHLRKNGETLLDVDFPEETNSDLAPLFADIGGFSFS